MSENNLWFGYLEAGEKSSPVVMDARLNTANPNTVYLFNFNRGEIIEYRRDIIEAKLRPLETRQGQDEKKLKSAYTKVRTDFTPRGGRVTSIPEKGSAKPAPKKPAVAANDAEGDELDSFIGDEVSIDGDWDE
jgi:hypothetical protein